MNVQSILKSKGSDGVVTVAPTALISEVAMILADKRIGTVVVSSDGRHAEGILSERDIVREIAVSGAMCLDKSVDTYMTTALVTCARTDSAEQVLSKMTEGRFRHMPVVEDGVMIGLITLGDVVKARLTQLAMEKDALEGMITSQW